MLFERVTTAYLGAKARGVERGQTLVEYGLIISLIAVAALVGITLVAGGVDSLWGWIADDTSNAVDSVLD